MNNFLEEKLLPVANKLAQNKFLSAIRDGVSVSIPFSIIGAFALIFACFPVESVANFFAPAADFLFSYSTVTLDCLGIIALIGIAYNVAVQYGTDPISTVLMSVASFLLFTLDEGFGLNTANFSAAGMFSAIIISFVVTMVFKFFVDKNFVIKLPDGVPPAIANSFVSLLPALANLTIAAVVRVALGIDLNTVITNLFAPLVSGMNSLPGYCFFVFLMCLLWVCGIHGDNTLSPISSPISAVLMAENLAAFAAGEPIPNIGTFISLFVNFSGTGATIGLVICMMLSKAKRYNQLGKLALGPALFNINEPVTFGAPVVMNPVLAIPYVLCPVVLTAATWLLMQFNIIGRVCIEVPWTCPPIIGAYLCTLDWKAAVWNAIEIVISYLFYKPFFAKQEAMELEAEKNA